MRDDEQIDDLFPTILPTRFRLCKIVPEYWRKHHQGGPCILPYLEEESEDNLGCSSSIFQKLSSIAYSNRLPESQVSGVTKEETSTMSRSEVGVEKKAFSYRTVPLINHRVMVLLNVQLVFARLQFADCWMLLIFQINGGAMQLDLHSISFKRYCEVCMGLSHLQRLCGSSEKP